MFPNALLPAPSIHMLGGLESSRLKPHLAPENPAHELVAQDRRQRSSEAWEDHQEGMSLSTVFARMRGKWLTGHQFIINASQPASDKIFDVSAFEKFLNEKIKVDNRTGNLGDNIKISQVGDGKIEVVAHMEFSGRYLKYLLVFSDAISSFMGLQVKSEAVSRNRAER